MALVSVPSLYWPHGILTYGHINSALGGVSLAFNSSTDRVAFVTKSIWSDSIAKVYFFIGAATTGADLDVRIESVTNGRPSGTLLDTNTNVVVTIADTDDGVWKTATLTAAASISPGTEFAIVFVNSSGTPNLTFRHSSSVVTGGLGQYPLHLFDPGTGTWASFAAGGVHFSCFIELTTAGVVHCDGLWPVGPDPTITAFNSGSASDEFAMKLVVPFKCRAVGVLAPLFNIAAGADFTVSLWPSSSTTDADALGQSVFDGDFPYATSTDGYVFAPLDDRPTIDAGTTLYAGVRADTANSFSVPEFTISSVANAMKATPYGSASCVKAVRAWSAGSAGSWTETATVFIPFHIVVDQLDDGASSGGGGGLRVIGG
jgi:hypothetical protein